MEYLDLVLSVMTHPLYVLFGIGYFMYCVVNTDDNLSTFSRVTAAAIITMIWPVSMIQLTISHYKTQAKFIIKIHNHLISEKDHD